MGRPDFEELEVYKLAESLANQIWEIVKKWDYFTKELGLKPRPSRTALIL